MGATVWKGHVTFGLVSIPVRLYKAARAEKVSFRQLHRRAPPDLRATDEATEPEPVRASRVPEIEPARGVEYSSSDDTADEFVAPVRNTLTSADDARPIARADIVKGFEYQPDRYVVVRDEELRSLAPKTSSDIQILEFVHLNEIDPVYFETSYYVAPDQGGEKPYALLHAALRKAGYVALGRIAMHRREHVAVIRPGERGILLHTMFYSNEVRNDQEFRADPQLVAEKELALALKLIDALAEKFDPEKFKDKYREQVEALIAAKIQGREVVAGAAQAAQIAPVVDIMDALKKSLAAARKPAQRAEASSAKAKPQRRTAKGG
jgi:DNA end-binding protein Ku